MYLYSYHSAEELGPPSANATVSASAVRVSAYAYETAKDFVSEAREKLTGYMVSKAASVLSSAETGSIELKCTAVCFRSASS